MFPEQTKGIFVYEARPVLFDEALGPPRIGCFIGIALFVYDSDVFCNGYLLPENIIKTRRF